MIPDSVYRAREWCIEWGVWGCRLLFPNHEDDQIATIISILHLLAPPALLLLFIHAPEERWWIWPIFLGVLGSNLIFQSCVMTKVEQRLSGNTHTVVDPFLSGLGIVITNQSRWYFTMTGLLIYFGVVGYYC